MSNCQITLLSILALATFSSVCGQSPVGETTPPPSPLQRTDTLSAWTIMGERKSAKHKESESGTVFKNKTVTKTGNLLHQVITRWDGRKDETWVIDLVTLKLNPLTGKVDVLDPRSNPSAPRYANSDFDELDWIDSDHFVSEEAKNGEKCLLYEWKERMPPKTQRASIKSVQDYDDSVTRFLGKPIVPTKAWINEKTHLPVVVEDENAKYLYKFDPPPAAMLALPPTLLAFWNDYKEADQKEAEAHKMPRQE